MSTRAGIIVKDSFSEVHFYRHSDGYPEGTMPTLNIFLKWLKDGIIRDDAIQSAGWLVIIGAMEYNTIPKHVTTETVSKWNPAKIVRDTDIDSIEPPSDWEVGSYEPTNNVNNHGDLEYIYTIDLNKQTITHRQA